MASAKVEQLMKTLNISESEAMEVIESDKRIDKGEKLFELPKELQAGAKKARQADRAPTVYQFQQRERKVDNDKRFLIDAIAWALTTDVPQSGDNVNADNVEITNPEREITFQYNGKKYKIVLSAPRS